MAIEGLQRSDAELIAAVRAGDGDAFGALYNRHAVAALTVARQYTDSVSDAEDVVADSFTAVYAALQGGKGPTEAFRAYLFTVVRRVATVRRDYGRRVRATDDVATLEASAVPMAGADAPALAGFESTVVARAFATLPERWQLVLWHTEVEGLTPAQVAPLLGLSANSASALAYRAREGLRQAYLTEHLADGLPERCRSVADRLGAYVRGGLGPRETRKVAAHLDECPSCTALLAELGDVNHGMRSVVAPLVLGIAGLGVLDHVLPVGGGLAALGRLVPGLTDGAAGGGAAAGGAGAGSAGGSGAGAAGASSSSAAPVVGVVAAVVALVVVAAVAVYALVGRHPASPAAAAAAASSGGPVATSPASPVPTPTASDAPLPLPSWVADQVAGPLTSLLPDTSGQPGGSGGPSAPVAAAPVVVAPVVAVDASGSQLALQAGRSGQELRLAVRNSGGEATALTAVLTLPEGVTLDSAPGLGGGGQSAPVSSWGCLVTSPQDATCTLARLGAGATSDLVLRVSVAEDYDGTGGDVTLQLSGLQDQLARIVVPVTVAAASEHVVVTPRAPLTLVSGRTRTLALDVANVGGTTGRASVVLRVPSGVHLGGPSPAGWTCLPRGLSEIGCTATLDRRSSLPLGVPLGTTSGTAPGTGLITVTAAPSSSGGTAVVPYLVVRPATLVVTPPASLGPLVPGATTDLPLTVTNTGGLASAPVTVDVALPAGVTLGGTAHGAGWTCTGTRCTHGGLAVGASATLTVPLTAGTSGAAGDITVTPSADDADAEPVLVPVQVVVPAPIPTTPPTARATFSGNVRVTQVGAPLLSCDTDPQCPAYLAGATNNNGLPMTPLDTDPPSGARPAQAVSSSTTLTYPSGQAVLWAGLYWSADAGPGDAWSTDRTSVRLRGPGGAYQQVSGTVVTDVTDSAGRRYYQSFADVTAQVSAAGGGTWSLADAAVAATATDPDPTYYAGWALVVVYGNPNAAGSRTVAVYDDGQWVGTGSPSVLTVPVAAGHQVTVGTVAWDGDASTTGDRLLLDGTALTPLRWDGSSGSSGNAFDSTATGWGKANSLGVDAKAFSPVTAASDLASLTATTTADQYLLGVVTVTAG